jgi:uncharacterized protein VirK/YbjX
MASQTKSGISLLFYYAVQIAKTRGFGKGRFFFLRSLLFPKAVTNWIIFIDNFFKKAGFDNAPWDVVATPLRLCLSNNFNAQTRSEKIQSHCEIIEKKFNKEFLKTILKGNETRIAVLSGKSGCIYELTFCYALVYRREGFLTVFLKDTSGKNLILSTITFTFFKNDEGSNSMLIGGLQGVPANVQIEDGKGLVVKSTRDLQGLRPKYAVLNCAYAIASCFDVNKIFAVSSKNHPVRLTNKRRSREFYADYDSFWQEVGGVVKADGNFELPSILPKRSAEEVPAKKKKDWLARYVHIDNISAMTKENLNLMFNR